jgi:hypothetical protein
MVSVYTQEEVKGYLKEALDARSKILQSQEYQINNRSNKRAMLSEVNIDIKKWEDELKKILAEDKKNGFRNKPYISYVVYGG